MKKQTLILLALAATLTMTACGAPTVSVVESRELPLLSGQSNTHYESQQLIIKRQESTSAPTNPATLTLEEAKALVFNHLGITESQVTRLETDRDDGKYEIEFFLGTVEYEFEVNIKSGEILEISRKDHKPVTQPEAPKTLTLEEAKALVFNHLGITESQVTRFEWELEKSIFELEFHVGRTEYEVEVDASTGRILEIDCDIDD